MINADVYSSKTPDMFNPEKIQPSFQIALFILFVAACALSCFAAANTVGGSLQCILWRDNQVCNNRMLSQK